MECPHASHEFSTELVITFLREKSNVLAGTSERYAKIAPTSSEQSEKVLQRSLPKKVLALGLLILLTIALAYQIKPSYHLSSRGVLTFGLHKVEGNPPFQFRWTNGHVLIRLNGIGRQHYKLTLDLSGERPKNIKRPLVRVFANETLIGSFTAEDSRQVHSFDLSSDSISPLGNLAIRIESETFMPLPDERTLGVGLYWLKLESGNQHKFVFPALLPLLWSLITSFFVWRTVRVIHSQSLWPGVLFVLCLSVLVYGLATERLFTVSALPTIALFCAIAAAAAEIKSRSTWLEAALALLVMLSAVNFTYQFFGTLHTSRFEDITKIFEAAQKLANGLDPYEYNVTRNDPLFAHSYVYPPAFAQFIEIFLPLGFENGIKLWVVLNFLLYIILIAVLARMFDLNWRSYGFYALLLIALNFRPAMDTLSNGQLDIMILALLVVTFAFAVQHRYFASGATLACAIIVKLQPVLMMPFYLTTRRWRALIGTAAAMVVIVSVSMVLNSPVLYERYLTRILPARGPELTGHQEDQSLSAFICRLNGVVGMNKLLPAQSRSIHIATLGVASILGLITLGVMWFSSAAFQDSKQERLQMSLSFSVFISLMMLVLPTSWIHYETQLLFPLVALLSCALFRGEFRLFIIWAICAFLIAFGDRNLFAGERFNEWPLILVQSYKFYGILLLWGTLVFAQFQISSQFKQKLIHS